MKASELIKRLQELTADDDRDIRLTIWDESDTYGYQETIGIPYSAELQGSLIEIAGYTQ